MRLVSLAPSLTDILQALNLSEDLVGITDECLDRLGGASRLGSSKSPKLEKILDLKPDLIFSDSLENPPQILREIREKFEVASFRVTSLSDVISTIAEIGKRTQRDSEMKGLIQQIYQEWQAAPQNPLRTVMLHWNNPISTFSGRTYASHLLEASGGWNIFREDPTPEVAIELEDAMDQKPDLLLLLSKPFSFDQKHEKYFQSLPSFASTKVHLVEGDLFLRYGPKTVTGLQTLKRLIQGIQTKL